METQLGETWKFEYLPDDWQELIVITLDRNAPFDFGLRYSALMSVVDAIEADSDT